MSDPTRGDENKLGEKIGRPSRTSSNEFGLVGEFTQRMIRGLQAFMNFDPTQYGGPSSPLSLASLLSTTALVADLTRAPFRKNGKAFITQARLPAGGAATFATLMFPNISDTAKVLHVAVLDWIEVTGGAGDYFYGFTIVGGAFNPLGYFTEDRQDKISAAATPKTAGTLKQPAISQTSSTPAALFADGVDADILGSSTKGKGILPLDGDVAIWPGVAFYAQDITGNLSINVTLKGRIWTFSPQAQI